MSPLIYLTAALSILVTASASGGYGRQYGYGVSPRRKLVKVIKVLKTPYVSKAGTTAVFRSPDDSYDEADAYRTVDDDAIYKIPYKPAILTVRKAHVPVHHVAEPEVHVPAYEAHHVAHDTHHVAPHVAHVPAYHYDYHATPECAIVGKHLYNLTACLEDPYYPTEAVLYELKRNPALTDRLMSDVTYQSADNLIDGLTKAEEEQYSVQHYYGPAHGEQDPYNAYAPSYLSGGGYICPSDVFYARVKRAVNTYGEWKVIVNMPDELVHDPAYKKFVQTSRLETCVHRGYPCSFVEHVPSKCLQKNAFVRLVAYDPKHGLHTDSFKLPSACSCHLSPRPYY